MKKFWKWFFIVLGILVVAALAFCVTMFFLFRGSTAAELGRGFGMYGGMMGRGFAGRMPFGIMGGFGLLRGLFGLGILVLAGFGVAHLVNRSKHPAVAALPLPVCANCGKPLATEWKACPHCGTPIQSAAPAVEPTKKAKASK